MLCHPRLPFIAGLDATRPAVYVWDCAAGEPERRGSVGSESTAYDRDVIRRRVPRTPCAAWHPHGPLLVVATEDQMAQWTPSGLSHLKNAPSPVPYRDLAFSPDGRTLWAAPSREDGEGEDGDDDWNPASDLLDLSSGTIRRGRYWDTGVAAHPGGGLVMTLRSDQGATLGLVARVDTSSDLTAMRVQRHALILDADGYETPVFSADGRHFAIRGNAYEQTLQVFEFPSLREVLSLALGLPYPGYVIPPEWYDDYRSWSFRNVAFAARPGVLWVGTPTGTLVEVDIDRKEAREHHLLDGRPVTALTSNATGDLVIATGGDLVLLAIGGDAVEPDNGLTPADRVKTFLDATSDAPDDGELEEHLVRTDGTSIWEPADLDAVTTATRSDPTWLQLRAAINTAFMRDT
ncbi:hypothetical protein I6A84_26230 [Frankia sp. CNm7]|nr:hypothetical protein [Frankia nepalensis]MBL7512488.1 hypothetical protein [Frankia nepalensis]MBL7521485.1 hypothetical protein [Frankia nepalensis]